MCIYNLENTWFGFTELLAGALKVDMTYCQECKTTRKQKYTHERQYLKLFFFKKKSEVVRLSSHKMHKESKVALKSEGQCNYKSNAITTSPLDPRRQKFLSK